LEERKRIEGNKNNGPTFKTGARGRKKNNQVGVGKKKERKSHTKNPTPQKTISPSPIKKKTRPHQNNGEAGAGGICTRLKEGQRKKIETYLGKGGLNNPTIPLSRTGEEGCWGWTGKLLGEKAG